ncbi:hypothetical protein Sjap_011141 [Stephania japonica]|uniref:SNRNP25 ubiquitin-like domain-containing protein n=1 Tax=Stephania japonica TaxID=461633 RepID=A0AAP0JB22_9MAGN
MNLSKNMKIPISTNPSKEEESLFKGSAMTKKGAYAALSYMSCAVLLVLFNKAALSSYGFPCANVITLFQQFYIGFGGSVSSFDNDILLVLLMVVVLVEPGGLLLTATVLMMMCSCAILYTMRRLKIIHFTAGESWAVSDNTTSLVPFNTLLHTLPLALSYLLYMLASMESVRGVNVPMYTTLRRTTVVFTMIVEYLLTRQKYSYNVVGSVALIVLGAFVAGARDLSFDSYGYAIVFIANITTAIYLATIARIGRSSGLNSFGLMWCNDVLTLETATVADLKEAVEHAFLQRLKEEDCNLICWSDVWSDFCLCFQGQKLINNNDQILLFGIHDGCQIHLVQHQSINGRISTPNQTEISLGRSEDAVSVVEIKTAIMSLRFWRKLLSQRCISQNPQLQLQPKLY